MPTILSKRAAARGAFACATIVLWLLIHPSPLSARGTGHVLNAVEATFVGSLSTNRPRADSAR